MNRIRNFREKILNTDFSKFYRRFIVLALAIAVVGGLAIGIGFRAQISQTMSYLHHEEKRQVMEDSYRHPDGEGHEEDDFAELAIKEPDGGMIAAFGIYGGLCLLLLAVFWLSFAAWLYKKACMAKMNGLLWLIAGLLGNAAAALLFLIARSLIRQKCGSCGSWQMKGKWFCTGCGAELNFNCIECGELCGAEDTYCPRCGHLLKHEK